MPEALFTVLRHLVQFGSARHLAEAEQLLGLVAQAEAELSSPTPSKAKES